MAGYDYEWQEMWILRWYGGNSTFDRRKPIRLIDRESLYGLIKDFEEACNGDFTLAINSVEQTTTEIDEILNRAPRNIFELQMHSKDFQYSLNLSSLAGGRTSIDGPISDDSNGLQRLLNSIEGRQAPLRWYHRLNRFSIMSGYRPSIAVRWSRDVKAERRIFIIATIAGAVAGLITGTIGR